jgi:hypothetical protein
MTRRALSACPISKLRIPIYAEPVEASVAAAAKPMVADRRGDRVPTPTSLGSISWDIRVATGNRGSHCGIKSGIEYDSSIVEVIVECQAKTRRTLKQTGEPGYTTAVGSGGDDGTNKGDPRPWRRGKSC